MSLLDQASLVLVPSAYRTGEVLVQKPLPTKFSDETGNYDGNDPQGSANLTFTRNSNATRVNSDGLVEKVRQNVLLYSNDFSNAAFGKINTSLTGGQADKDGGTDAWKWAATSAATAQLTQTVTVSGNTTVSVYAKAGNRNTFSFWIGAAVSFDLSSGTVTAGNGKIESVGGGWYRCSAIASSSYNVFNPFFAASAIDEYIYIQNAQLEVSDFGPTAYIPTTTSARSTFAGISVDGTSVPNVPRLDYSGGATCGKLLLESQRTNLALWSEAFDNAGWVKDALTVTANATISPDGYQNADLLTAGSGSQRAYQTYSTSSGIDYTISIYAKKGTSDTIKLTMANVAGGPTFTFSTASFDTVSGWTSGYESLANGWYRIYATRQSTSTNAGMQINLPTAGQSVYVWGAQFEAGSYATSYIPTLGASVTRLADSASRTNIANLIGQTEGTFFVDFEYLDGQSGNNENWFALESDAGNDRVLFYKGATVSQRILIQVNGSNVYQNSYLAAISAGTRYKLAVRYNSGDIAVYVNGSQIATDATTYTRTDNLNNITFNESVQPLSSRFNQMLVFPEGLTNAQLAELTAL